MFREVSSRINLPELEEKIIEYWKKHDVFQKSLDLTKNGENFVYYTSKKWFKIFIT